MESLEQQVKELQIGLGAVVQALTFIQTFLESDYGLKFQFHAYRSSPVYSQHSSLLESLKTKYGQENESFHSNKASSVTFSGNEGIQYHAQEESSLESNMTCTISSVSSSSNPSMTVQTFVPLRESGESRSVQSQSHHHTTPPLITGDLQTICDKSTVIVQHEGIPMFNVTELEMKQELATEMYHDEDDELDAFASDGDDENEGEGDEDGESVEDHTTISNEDTHVDEDEASTLTVEQPCGSAETSGESRKSVATSQVKSKSKRRKVSDKHSEFKCPHCRRRCADQAALELHMTHHKQQFQCSQCGIWLADKSVLNRHMRMHTGSRPFSCEFCSDSFARQDIAKKHIQRKHKDMLRK
ncbi:putative zinc finger protein [Orchesella cincta]|uniref:Putative zinc finger protein n=1 Tax=Orchesella cincta TaxID=48709 RepID=A0A1D2MQ60_ORCCI|nr:putative zinc finger protein [Orchesella cincta]